MVYKIYQSHSSLKIKKKNFFCVESESFEFVRIFTSDGDGVRGGWEWSVIRTMSLIMNFTLSISPPPNGELWGEERNGSYTGL